MPTLRSPWRDGSGSCYNRILAEELLYARTWNSENERRGALKTWNLHYNYHRPRGAADGQPPASLTPLTVDNVMASYTQSVGELARCELVSWRNSP